MLQRLETADRFAELLARLHVVECHGVGHFHAAHRLKGQCGNGLGHHCLDHRQPLLGDQHGGRLVELDLGRTAAIHGAETAHGGVPFVD